MTERLINNSSLSPGEKNKAKEYLASYRNTEVYYDEPPGAKELFKILLGDIDDKTVEFTVRLFDNYMHLQDTGGCYENAYEDLSILSNNEFSVDNFKIIIDGNSKMDPYFGYVEFYHKQERWFYAPDTTVSEFYLSIFRYLNYFLALSGISLKRFVTNCCPSSMEGQMYTEQGSLLFIDKNTFGLLKDHGFVHKSMNEDYLFWQPNANAKFFSAIKDKV